MLTSTVPLAIYQFRFKGEVTTSWRVTGVASVDFPGGTNNQPPSYALFCNTTANNGSQIIWRREDTALEFSVRSFGNGARMELRQSEITHARLGIYICEDKATGEVLRVKLTDGELVGHTL